MLWPSSEIITGRQAIQSAFQQLMDRGVIENNIEIVDLVPIGEKAAYEIGKYTSKITLDSGITITNKGKYVVIWKHDGESWKLDVDITNRYRQHQPPSDLN